MRFNLSHWVLSSGIMRVDSYTCLLYYLHMGCHKLCQLTSVCFPLAIWLPCIATVTDITYLTSSLHAIVESMHSFSSRPDSLPFRAPCSAMAVPFWSLFYKEFSWFAGTRHVLQPFLSFKKISPNQRIEIRCASLYHLFFLNLSIRQMNSGLLVSTSLFFLIANKVQRTYNLTLAS
jgi:hypothetical protein